MRFLMQLMILHVNCIFFLCETLDTLLAAVPLFAPKDVYDKLIHAFRGGYCFELNGLFLKALRDAGFTSIRLVAARVLWADENSPLGRSHIVKRGHLACGGGCAEPKRCTLEVGFGAGVPRAASLC